MKKIIVTILALVLVMGLATVALATGTADVCAKSDDLKHDFSKEFEYTAKSSSDKCIGATYSVMTCKYCGQTDPATVKLTKEAPKDHELDPNQTRTKTAATCTTHGVSEVFCTVCKTWVEQTGSVAPKHANIVTEKKDPTCVDKGFKKSICTACGEIVLDEEIKATGKHTFDLDKCNVENRATCTADGNYKGKCTVCAQEFSVANGNYTGKADDGTDKLKIAKRNHAWDDGVVTEPVTCQKDGKCTFSCKNTKDSYTHEACNATNEVTLKHDVEVYNDTLKMMVNKYHKLVRKAAEVPNFYVYQCTVAGCTFVSGQIYEPKGATPGGTTPGGTTPGSSTPGSSSGGSNTSGGSKNTPSTNSKGVTIPATGDNTNSLPFVMIVVALAGIAALAISKRKVNG